jgi:hypothetical protein
MPQEKLKLADLIEQERLFWRQHGYHKEITVEFPEYKTKPLLVRLAVWLIRAYGGVFRITFHEIK